MAPPPAPEDARVRDRLRRRESYGLILLLVAASIVFQMAAPVSDASRFVTVVLQAAILVLAVWIAGSHRRLVRVAALAAVGAALAALVLWIVRGDIPKAAAALTSALLVAFAPLVIGASLLRRLRGGGPVTAQIVSGVLSIYLLAGIVFSFAFGTIDAIDPGSLFAGNPPADVADELYFSFVTLCTVGYGDYTPGSSVARAFSVAEMLVGQIYLVTVVSVIVGNLGRRRAG
jgi:hypothetical protein